MIAALLGLALLCGELRPQPAASFWCARPGATVRHQGGQVWRATAEGAAYDVVTAQGDWRWVEVGGRLVGGTYRVWFPMMGTPGP